MRSTTTIMLLGGLLFAARAEAAEVKVLSAGAVRAVVTEVADVFAKESGHSVKGTFGTVGVVRGKLAAGEPADVVIATDAAIDEMAKQGLVVAGTRTDIARVALVGPLPTELQKVTIYSAGLAAKAATPEAARAFIAFLTSPLIKEKFAAAGLDYQEALSEPTRIVWNNPRDPQLARFQETSASCYAEADAAYPPSGASGSRRPGSQRQQYWFSCMKTKGYEPREVSGR